VRVELLLAPDCPNAAAARAVLVDCLSRLRLPTRVCERVGGYPSPTILVDGVDVMTGAVGAPPMHACRLDAPTESRLLAALAARLANRDPTVSGVVVPKEPAFRRVSKSSAACCSTIDPKADERRRRA
jgi:hypothetical protein